MDTPDYSQYTLDELNDALSNIDRENYPQKVQRLTDEINRRNQAGETNSSPVNQAPIVPTPPNLLMRFWRGEYSLPVSYWLIGIGINILIYGLAALAKLGIAKASSSSALGAYIIGLYGAIILLTALQSVGIFRSANKHPLRGGSPAWAFVAKAMVCIGLFSFFMQMYISGFSIIKTSFEEFVGIEKLPQTQFRILNKQTELEVIGGIELGSERLLKEQLKLYPEIKLVHLHSIGGRLLAAERMMQIVRDHELDTYVKTECSSSCTLVYLAGKNKLLAAGAKLKFHSPSFGALSGHEIKEFGDKLANLYLDEGIPKWFVSKVVSTPNNSFWEPSVEELMRANVIDKVVDPDIYAYSGLGKESGISFQDYETGLLNFEYLEAMKEHDLQAFQKISNTSYASVLKGLPLQEITNAMNTVIYAERLPVYLANASDSAIVEYYKAQIFTMKELRPQYPLACASFAYPDQIPVEYHYGNQGSMSEQGKSIEMAALANLIKTYKGTHSKIDKDTQEAQIQEVIEKVRAEREDYLQVISSASDFVDQGDLICGASIALLEAFISFDTEKSGALLRSIQG